jgi:16S rRNA (cytosine967-C5)-methyltransferase
MTPPARISASVDILADIEARHRPAADALKDWGLSHRFAGSGDRAAIAGLVYDALRRKASAAFLMGEESARANLIGMLHLQRGLDAAAIGSLFDGSRFAPEPLRAPEAHALASDALAQAPDYIRGDYPEWLDPYFARVFGAARAEEGAALAQRAPLDMRVNTLIAGREKALATLAHLAVTPTPWSPVGLRLATGPDAKSPAIQSEPAFIKGMIEVQDEGSQLAALLSGATTGEQVVDLCAGAGGKTLALAAMMEKRGQIYATDLDKRRLAPIYARIERAGARNVQVRTPKGRHDDSPDSLADLAGRIDLVLIDAPCTGTGTWRRNPDAKWRMRPGALEQRVIEQAQVLDRAAPLVKPGGRIVYVTCSVLAEEGPDQVASFLARHPDFASASLPVADALGEAAPAFAQAVWPLEPGLLMTPRKTGTDGFFVSILRRAA